MQFAIALQMETLLVIRFMLVSISSPVARVDLTLTCSNPDFANGWEAGILQKALDECNCNPYGDPTCCVAKGIFTMDQSKRCYVSNTVNEQSTFYPSSLILLHSKLLSHHPLT